MSKIQSEIESKIEELPKEIKIEESPKIDVKDQKIIKKEIFDCPKCAKNYLKFGNYHRHLEQCYNSPCIKKQQKAKQRLKDKKLKQKLKQKLINKKLKDKKLKKKRQEKRRKIQQKIQKEKLKHEQKPQLKRYRPKIPKESKVEII